MTEGVQANKGQRRRAAKIRALSLRDGFACWYCNAVFAEESEVTLEHLCPASHGGPSHLSNLVLSCNPCNKEAGNLSVAEKVIKREKKRRKRGLA